MIVSSRLHAHHSIALRLCSWLGCEGIWVTEKPLYSWLTSVSPVSDYLDCVATEWLKKKKKIDLLCPNLGLLRLPENIHWTHWMAKIISVACHSDSLLVFAFFKLILSLSWYGLFLQIILHFFIIIQIYFLYLPVNLTDAADHHSRKIKTTECCKDYY